MDHGLINVFDTIIIILFFYVHKTRLFKNKMSRTLFLLFQINITFKKGVLLTWNYKVIKYNIIIHLTLIDRYRISYV